ncbi:hypothetical protein ABZO31_03435 [Streptomyces sp. HUAS MG47]|uniref:hypothetical protein n=1 Tax=Streptomyces solicamelliae TaxID=3231716 RepID=UPI0038779375
MRKVLRGAVVAAAIAPAVMLSVGVANADTYDQLNSQAGPAGASVSSVVSGTTAAGEAFHATATNSAGPEGTSSSLVTSDTADQAADSASGPAGLNALLGGLFG